MNSDQSNGQTCMKCIQKYILVVLYICSSSLFVTVCLEKNKTLNIDYRSLWPCHYFTLKHTVHLGLLDMFKLCKAWGSVFNCLFFSVVKRMKSILVFLNRNFPLSIIKNSITWTGMGHHLRLASLYLILFVDKSLWLIGDIHGISKSSLIV